MSRYVTINVDVDVDPYDLEREGWHHKSKCGVTLPDDDDAPTDDLEQWQHAAEVLHRTAHPREPLDIERCLEEPCRTLHARDADATKVRG